MAKKIVGYIKLQVPAGKANPSPPIGPALGQRGLNIMEFCKAFNRDRPSRIPIKWVQLPRLRLKKLPRQKCPILRQPILMQQFEQLQALLAAWALLWRVSDHG